MVSGSAADPSFQFSQNYRNPAVSNPAPTSSCLPVVDIISVSIHRSFLICIPRNFLQSLVFKNRIQNCNETRNWLRYQLGNFAVSEFDFHVNKTGRNERPSTSIRVKSLSQTRRKMQQRSKI